MTENFTSSFGRLRQKIAPKSVPSVQHDFFPSFNQSNHWFVVLSLSLSSSFLNFLVSWEQRLSSQRTNLTGSHLINRGFLANIYFLSKLRMHLQSVANITEKKRSPNNSKLTDKKPHCSLTWKPKMGASTIAITINKTVTAPTVSQSSKSRRIQHSPKKALINSERKKLTKFIFKSKRFDHHYF